MTKHLTWLITLVLLLNIVPFTHAQDDAVCDMDRARTLYNEALGYMENGDTETANTLLSESQAIMTACANGAPNVEDVPELPFQLPDGIVDPANKILANGAWIFPVVYDFGGVDMVLVPAGCVNLGSDTTLDYEIENESQPVHLVCFDEPFWIDRFEVTNAQVSQFTDQTFTRDELALPYRDITWFEAQAYCEERGARLPTEAEWEYAARGPDSLAYPWGNSIDGNLLNSCDSNCTEENADPSLDDGYATVAPSGKFPTGDSWVGAQDMAGNVWEWTSSIYDDYPYDAADGRESLTNTTAPRVVRGGAWAQDFRYARTSVRAYPPPDTAFEFYGVRCATEYIAFTEVTPEATPEPTAEPEAVATEETTDINDRIGDGNGGPDGISDEAPE